MPFDESMAKYFKCVGMLDPTTMKGKPWAAPQPGEEMLKKIDKFVDEVDPMVASQLVMQMYPNQICFTN